MSSNCIQYSLSGIIYMKISNTACSLGQHKNNGREERTDICSCNLKLEECDSLFLSSGNG